MKKSVAILIALVMVMSLAVNAVASGSEAIILGNAKFTELNEEQVITIEAENLDSISVIQLVLQYDSSKIELQNVVEAAEDGFTLGQVKNAAGAFTTDANICRTEPGIITIIWEAAEPISGSGVIANLTFKALVAGAGIQKISVTTYDGDDSFVGRDNASNVPEIVDGFNFVEAASYIVGDVDGNGYVDSMDASFVLQKVAAMDVDINTDAADVDGSGYIDSMDASYILQYVAHIITSFPVENNG